MSQDFIEFMHRMDLVTKTKRAITRKPLIQLLYLHRLIDPYITLLSKNTNFLNQTLGKFGIIISLVTDSGDYEDSGNTKDKKYSKEERIKTINAIDIQLTNIIEYTRSFMNDIMIFKKKNVAYLKDSALIGLVSDSEKVLETFLKENQHMLPAFEAFQHLYSKLKKHVINNGSALATYEVAALRTFCDDMKQKYLNTELQIKRLRKLKYDFYFKNGMIAREFEMLRKASEDETLVRKYLLNKNNYSQYLKNGDVILSYKLYNYIRKDWFTRAVNRVTKSAATHAGIYHNGKVAEARQNGSSVRLNDIHTSKNEILIIFRPQITNDQIIQIGKRIEEYCTLEKGKPKYGYNWKGLAGFLIARKHQWLSGLLPANKAFFCSEFVAKVFDDVGIQLAPYKEPALVSPKDLLESKILKFTYLLDATTTFRNVLEEQKDFEDMIVQAKKLLEEKMVNVQY